MVTSCIEDANDEAISTGPHTQRSPPRIGIARVAAATVEGHYEAQAEGRISSLG